MKPNETGTDPVAMLYDRVIVDLWSIHDCHKQEILSSAACPNERGPSVKQCWGLFDSFIETYRVSFLRFNESQKFYRDTRQQPQVGELIFRTRAIQLRAPSIDVARVYLDKSKKLYMVLHERLEPVEGKRTLKAFYAKVKYCQKLWKDYGFTFEENNAIPELIEALQNEFALIEKDRKPTFSATPPTTSSYPPNKVGRPLATWTAKELKIWSQMLDGATPLTIAGEFKMSHSDATSLVRRLRQRARSNPPPER